MIKTVIQTKEFMVDEENKMLNTFLEDLPMSDFIDIKYTGMNTKGWTIDDDHESVETSENITFALVIYKVKLESPPSTDTIASKSAENET